MSLREFWQSTVSTWKQGNPFTMRFVSWYLGVAVVIIMIIVGSRVVPMLRETRRLNQEIQQGKIYIKGQNPLLEPSVEDFILPDDGDFDLGEKFYPLRRPQKRWRLDEVQQFWDHSDQKKLKDLRQENRKMLQEQLQDLP